MQWNALNGGLIGHPSRHMDDIGAKGDLNCAGMALDVPVEMNFSMRPREYFGGILVKIWQFLSLV